MTTRYFDPPRPRLFGHRGSSAHYPENTLVAFAAAVEAAMPYLELDVWSSADGAVVVHHDETLQRMCSVQRPITGLTLAEIKELDAGLNFSPDGGQTFPFRGQGVGIPTLAEVLRHFPDTCINIEIKQSAPPIEAAVLRVVAECGARERVLLASEKDEVLARLRPLCGEIPTNLALGEARKFFDGLRQGVQDAHRPPGNALQIPRRYQGQDLITRHCVAAAHHLGLEVHVWTVNDEAEMRELLELGVDGLMSDHPARLRRVAEEWRSSAANN